MLASNRRLIRVGYLSFRRRPGPSHVARARSFAEHGQPGVALPLYISAAGIVAAVIGTLFVRTHEKASQNDLLKVPCPA